LNSQIITPPSPTPASPFAVLRDVRVLQVIAQIVFIVLVLLIITLLVNNVLIGLRRAGLTPGFDFLNLSSGFQIDEGLSASPHVSSDTFLHAFGVGLVNTLRVLVICLIGASLLGLFVGVARLSTNWLLRTLARAYIELFQNTPLLVQLIFLYYGVFVRLPIVREATVLPGPVFISNKGLAFPALWVTPNTGLWTLIVFFASVAAFAVYRSRRRKMIENGQAARPLEWALLLFFAIVILATFILGPYLVSLPERVRPERFLRYNADAGVILSPEFFAISLGLILYTGAFIAEIVRSGIQSVPNGQWEAARAMGLSNGQALRLVILPQALRVMFPPLTNQYSAMLKNSALGAYIGFTDLFGVGRTIQLQSGQSIPVTLIVMAIYLVLTLIIAYVMNTFNARFQLRTR